MSTIKEIWTIVQDDHGGEGTLPYVGLFPSLNDCQEEVNEEFNGIHEGCGEPYQDTIWKDEHDHVVIEGRSHIERWTIDNADITFYFTQHLV